MLPIGAALLNKFYNFKTVKFNSNIPGTLSGQPGIPKGITTIGPPFSPLRVKPGSLKTIKILKISDARCCSLSMASSLVEPIDYKMLFIL